MGQIFVMDHSWFEGSFVWVVVSILYFYHLLQIQWIPNICLLFRFGP